MKLETYLNALEYAVVDYCGEHFKGSYPRRQRQGKAFRARILKMDGELEASEAYLVEALELMNQHWERIQDLKKQLAEKDAEIARLKNWNKILKNRPVIEPEDWGGLR